MTYERYCADLKRFNQPITMDEKEWRQKYGIEEKYTPFISRKSTTGKKVEPSLHNNETSKNMSKTPLKVNLLDIPKQDNSELMEELEKRIKEKKPRAEKKERILTRRPNSVPKTSLAGMSQEQKREHKNQLNKQRRAMEKEKGIVHTRSEEQRAKQLAYSREYYEKNKEVQREKERVRRANMSEEKKLEIKLAYMKWQKENREHVNATARAWKAKNKEKISAQKKEYDRRRKEAKNNTFVLQNAS